MSNKSRRSIAWIALAFMVLFVAALTAWGFDRSLFNGAIGYAAIFTGGLGIGLFVVLYFTRPRDLPDDKPPEKPEEKPPADDRPDDLT